MDVSGDDGLTSSTGGSRTVIENGGYGYGGRSWHDLNSQNRTYGYDVGLSDAKAEVSYILGNRVTAE